MTWSSACKTSAGFTLMEMLVVLPVLGILSAAALPRLQLGQGARLRAAAHALATDMRMLRDEAMRRGTSTMIAPASAGYVLTPTGQTRPLPIGATLTIETAAAALLPDGGGAICFFPDGSSSGGILTLRQGALLLWLRCADWTDGFVSMSDRQESGFTLLEVLVALVILVAGLAAFYQAFGIGLLSGASAERERRAAQAAENLLAELGRTRALREGITTGELSSGQRWKLRLEPFVPFDQGNSLSPVSGHVATLEIEPAAGRGRSLHVQTFLLDVQK